MLCLASSPRDGGRHFFFLVVFGPAMQAKIPHTCRGRLTAMLAQAVVVFFPRVFFILCFSSSLYASFRHLTLKL